MYDSGRVKRIQSVATSLFRPDSPFGVIPLNLNTHEPLTAETLCSRYAERVYRFAAMVARNDIEAEDIAQEALERSVRKLGQFDTRRGTRELALSNRNQYRQGRGQGGEPPLGAVAAARSPAE